MKKLEDKKTGLVWYIPEVEEYTQHNPIYTPEDERSILDFSKELNEHTSEEIIKYVTGDCAPLGNFIHWAAIGKKTPCYCFDDGKLVATALISPNNTVSQKLALFHYIRYCEANPTYFKDGIVGHISYKHAKQTLEQATATNNTSVDYLVVIPTSQGRGIGTRAIASIKNNTSFFAPENEVKTIETQIHKSNLPSQKAFKRNGFGIYTLDDFQTYTPLEDYLSVL